VAHPGRLKSAIFVGAGARFSSPAVRFESISALFESISPLFASISRLLESGCSDGSRFPPNLFSAAGHEQKRLSKNRCGF
jgi:hypothetical protein